MIYDLKSIKANENFKNNIENFVEILTRYNKVHNLTSAKNEQEIYNNIEDSLFPLSYLEKKPQIAVDIGSGAGFPAMILAIAMPECIWHLVEPKNKKSAFLFLVKAELELQNVQIHTTRIENLDGFNADLITSRAVSKTRLLLELCRDFVGEDTQILLYKGSSLEKEIKNLKKYSIIENGARKYFFIRGKDAY